MPQEVQDLFLDQCQKITRVTTYEIRYKLTKLFEARQAEFLEDTTPVDQYELNYPVAESCPPTVTKTLQEMSNEAVENGVRSASLDLIRPFFERVKEWFRQQKDDIEEKANAEKKAIKQRKIMEEIEQDAKLIELEAAQVERLGTLVED